MNKQETMIAAALNAMRHCLKLSAADRVLVLTDLQTLDCGQAFAAAAESLDCPTETIVLPDEGRPLKQVPEQLASKLDDRTIVVNALVGDAAEIPFRIEWIRLIEDSGRIRLGHSPGIDADMMVSGALNVDYRQMVRRAEMLIEAFKGADTIRVRTPAGTDLEMKVAGRSFVSDLEATLELGVNMPCGEVYCCPVEDGANGTLVVDGCYGSAGIVPTPVTMTVNNGKVVTCACADSAILADISALLDTDSGSRTIAELGIGLNPGARLTGRMLEAEKANETAHIAFGANDDMPGGQNKSSTHIDYLIKAPTLEAVFPGGVTKLVMENGR